MHHWIYVNQFYDEAKGKMVIESIGGGEVMSEEGNGLYMLLEEKSKRDCEYEGYEDVAHMKSLVE